MTRRTIGVSAVALAVATLTAGAVCTSGVATAQSGVKAAAGPGLPHALRAAAIATRSDRSGRIAGARIGDTHTYVVYVRTAHGCGSGGCRAQVWTDEDGRFVRSGSLPVGRLPIVVLDETSGGMPLLGVTVRDARSGMPAILPVAFDGHTYSQRSDRLLPASIGKPLLTEPMLRPF